MSEQSEHDGTATPVSRAERRRQDRVQRKTRPINPEGDYGVQLGWFQSLDNLDEAKRSSHDMLIASMGDRRVGPVQWRWWTGDKATETLNLLWTGETDQYANDAYRRIAAHLREYGGYLIVAMAEGRAPASTAVHGRAHSHHEGTPQ